MNNKYLIQPNVNTSKFDLQSKSIVAIILVTAIGINYFYSTSMMFLTTFVLAYLTKGIRRK